MKVGIAEAKAKFAALVAMAEAGERVTITRKGRDVAVLGPAPRERLGSLPEIVTVAGMNAAFEAHRKVMAMTDLPAPPIVPQTPQKAAGLTLRDVTRAALDG